MMTGSGRVPIGESAASLMYRITLAPDKKASSTPEYRPQDAFVVTIPEPPPQPPREPMRPPQRPTKFKEWDEKPFTWRVRHHLGWYRHDRWKLKEEANEQAKRDYGAECARWREDQARYDREKKEFLVKQQEYRTVKVKPPPPPTPALAEMAEYEKAVIELRDQLKGLEKKMEDQERLVLEMQNLAHQNALAAKEMMRMPGSESGALLKAKRYLAAKRQLDEAVKTFTGMMDECDEIADALKKLAEAERQRAIGDNLNKVAEKTAEDLEEINGYRRDLEARKLPESVMADAQKTAAESLKGVMREWQQELANETENGLNPVAPQNNTMRETNTFFA